MTADSTIEPLIEIDLEAPIEQLRAVPVDYGSGERGLLLVYSDHPIIDPWAPIFTFPEDTLKLALASSEGEMLWRKDLGPGVVPGIWFCPVFPFDLNGDGIEEIWYVDNTDEDHPLNYYTHRLARIDPSTGETTGTWEWPDYAQNTLAYTFRNFILGGHVGGEPVLVTALGTYGDMKLQAWNPDMTERWTRIIDEDDAGAQGSHMCPVIDLDGDGDDELLWGERLVDLGDGSELFCADRGQWNDHSDIVMPTRDRRSDEWYLYTIREKKTQLPPRVVTFDARGERVWTDVDEGHMHFGWTARLGDGGEHVAMAGKRGHAEDEEREEFTWSAYTGERCELDYPVSSARPVDIDGDGVHELVYRGQASPILSGERSGTVIDREGNVLGSVDPNVAKAQPSKLFDHPGEQIVTYRMDGTVRVWGDRDARDVDDAHDRYDHPYYRKAQRLSAVGYNWHNVAGL